MTTSITVTVTEDGMSILVDGHTRSIATDHPNYAKIKAALIADDLPAISKLISIANQVIDYGKGKFSIVAGQVIFDGKPMHNACVDRVLKMMREGYDLDPMLAFLDRLYNNTSFRVVNELWPFLEKSKVAIDPEGYIIAYKVVRNDYMDKHTGTFDNSVGETPNMPRRDVDDNQDKTCSDGLHFCSETYLPWYGSGVREGGDRVMIVRVDPANVVAIPTDHKDAKGRAWIYEVIGELDFKGQEDVDKFVKKGGLDVAVYDSHLKDYALMPRAEAATALGITRGALNKRILRGTMKTTTVGGEEMVKVHENLIYVLTSPTGAAKLLDISADAVRGRIRRGTLETIVDADVKMVRVAKVDIVE